ncbi:MAG: carbamoyltransferase HypF [Lachnospiraceae bacterium]|nr:carbamoyltransferase HypF [Lachnospiraceae bacterium]
MERIIRIYGVVQGVGFRPFVSRLARELKVTGSVSNKGSYVEVIARGEETALDELAKRIKSDAPERSTILKTDVREYFGNELDSFPKEKPYSEENFVIKESEKEAGDIFVSPDIATCDKCRKELYDPNDRRYMHPFINCTACGPRVTILDAMPYDRVRTSMGEFPMCSECEREYTSPETRRYDAQPVCCNECGPHVYITGSGEEGREAISLARKSIAVGKIIAVKGIGGFHLCCDAKNEEAVHELRVRKNRPVKPFAVMMKDIETVKENCEVTPLQEEIIIGHQKPILLLKKKKESRLAASIAPGNPYVGVMLPYAPVQMLLFEYNDGFDVGTDCFVMTSGNVSGAPICRDDEDAVAEIGAYVDLILSHNRKIRLRCDDSVMDFYEDEPYMIRRSRGYAPLPVMMSEPFKGTVLAIGGELKNTFCIAKDTLFYPSPYVGDMEDVRTVKALRESVVRMETLLEAEHTVVACDMHPGYNTTSVAREFEGELFPVQHHYAHVLSCMAENDLPTYIKVLGVSFDGTGYGTDGTIWGGEFLMSDYDGFERRASIKPFKQPGGDSSSKEGWRIAVAMLCEIYGEAEGMDKAVKLGLDKHNAFRVIPGMLRTGINTVTSTSAGRLFDAVSAVLDVKQTSTFEGEAATSLEFLAEEYEKKCIDEGKDPSKEYPDPINDFLSIYEDGGRYIMRTDLLFTFLCEEALKGEERGKLAYAFHEILSRQIAHMCDIIIAGQGDEKKTSEFPVAGVALTGGVYQNKLLLRLTQERLNNRSVNIYRHRLIPPNDGGICLGQAVAAMRHICAAERSGKEK